MRLQSLGHVVLKVRDLNRSVPFYRDVLGLKEVGKEGGKMVFFSFVDNHHDVALLETDQEAVRTEENSSGLHHVAFKVGDSLGELREAKDWLIKKGVEPHQTLDHIVTQSVYFHDPDGNQVEVFVESDPSVWHEDPSLVTTSNPLDLV
jgi:catechol 2,3-dioxygenase